MDAGRAHPFGRAGVLGVVALVLGVVVALRPTDSTDALARWIGAALVVLGATFLVRVGRTRRLDVVDGVVWVAVGVGALVWPDPTVRGLAIVVGAALVATGVIELASAAVGATDERLVTGIGGISSIGFGIAALAWPTATVLVLAVIVGARLIVAGVALLLPRVRRPAGWLRVSVGLVGVLAAVLVASVSVGVHRAQPDGPGEFYAAPDELPGGPGTVIRSEVIDPYVAGATTYRVLYVTSDAQGEPTTSSGLVIVPDTPAPEGGRPVLAFTHGTTGIAASCAPSLLPGDRYGPAIGGLDGFLAQGFVVAATDYPGLGSDGTTAYLVGAAEARAALDSVRAAVAMPEADARPDLVVFGESQGGHAALFTGEEAATYAPDLRVAGVAAAAPATDLRELFEANAGTTFGDVLAAYALGSWANVYGVDLADIATPQAIPVIDRLGDLCIQNQQQMLSVVPEAELLKISFLSTPPWEREPWATILADNTPGGTNIDVPVLIAQGEIDPLVKPEVQAAFVDAWCGRGQAIEYRTYPGVGHLDAGHAAAADVVAWARARVDGEPWQGTC